MIQEQLKEIFPETSDEYITLVDAYNLVVSSAPTTTAEAKTQLILFDSTRIKLSSIYFMITKTIDKIHETNQVIHDQESSSIYAKMTNPSNTAVETKLRNKNPAYAMAVKQCNDLEKVKTLILSYLNLYF